MAAAGAAAVLRRVQGKVSLWAVVDVNYRPVSRTLVFVTDNLLAEIGARSAVAAPVSVAALVDAVGDSVLGGGRDLLQRGMRIGCIGETRRGLAASQAVGADGPIRLDTRVDESRLRMNSRKVVGGRG